VVVVRRVWALSIGAVPLLVVACQSIAKLRDIAYVPDAGCVSRPLPSTGAGRIRLVNAGTSVKNADFCVRASGTTDWGAPLLGDLGTPCETGLAYAQATVPFAVAAGSIDIEAIPAGMGCDVAATSPVLGVTVPVGGPVMTIIRMAGGSTPERLVAYPEELVATDPAQAERVRVVDALSSSRTIDFGVAVAGSEPPTLQSGVAFTTIAPGGIASVGDPTFANSIDAAGYFHLLTTVTYVAVAFDSASTALFALSTSAAGTQTLFAIGDPSDSAHPPRGLYCQDSLTQPSVTDDGGLDDGGSSGAPPVLAACTLTDLPSLTIDTVNASLYGAAAPFESDRRPFIYAAIAAETSDLMCIVELATDDDKENVIAAAKANFPYAYFTQPPATIDTQPNDPTQADGGSPAPLSVPPCAPDDVVLADPAIECAATMCSSTADATGFLSDTGCLTAECAAEFLPVLHGTRAQQECYDCLIFHLASEEPVSNATGCETDTRRPLGFGGQTTSVILSKHPLSNTQTYILPSTGYRRAVLSAEVALGEESIDFYCAQLSSPLIQAEVPYTGAYGALPALDGGPSAENGWADEQLVQVAQVVRLVQSNAATSGRAAVVAGDWHASHPPAGTPASVVSELSPGVIMELEAALTLAEPDGYAPACNYCPTNPYSPGVSPVDLTQTFLYGFSHPTTTADRFWALDEPVTFTHGPYNFTHPPASGMAPVFEYTPRTVYVTPP
jgi:hypothetical protein